MDGGKVLEDKHYVSGFLVHKHFSTDGQFPVIRVVSSWYKEVPFLMGIFMIFLCGEIRQLFLHVLFSSAFSSKNSICQRDSIHLKRDRLCPWAAEGRRSGHRKSIGAVRCLPSSLPKTRKVEDEDLVKIG